MFAFNIHVVFVSVIIFMFVFTFILMFIETHRCTHTGRDIVHMYVHIHYITLRCIALQYITLHSIA